MCIRDRDEEASGDMIANPANSDGDNGEGISACPIAIIPEEIRDVGRHMEPEDDISDATFAGAGEQVPAHKIPSQRKYKNRIAALGSTLLG